MRYDENMDSGNKDKPKLKKFKLNPKYTHHRSEGLTRRRNKGSALQDRENFKNAHL